MPRSASRVPSKVIVIGGSQGAVEGILKLAPELPSDIPAAIFVVIHVPTDADSYLPNLLRRRGTLPVMHPKDGEPIRAGHIYVAPPDFQMTLEPRVVRVQKGPRENRHRPAIDPLFRSAARVFGPRVIAVVLSGNLDDGAAGLLAVRKRGGVSVIQDPNDARVGEMPRRALNYAGSDYVLPLSAIAPKIIELAHSRVVAMKRSKSRAKAEPPEIRENEEVSFIDESNGKPSVFACPECHGVLWELKDGKKMVRYRCRVGHGYTEATLKQELDETSERALWAAMRALEEKAAMARRMVQSSRPSKDLEERLKDQAKSDTENAHVIRKIIFDEA